MRTTPVVKVGMAELNVATAPHILTTLGLGSCVGIALYDPVMKLGGLAHIMLPDSTQIRNNSNAAKFADTGLAALVDKMIKSGAKQSRLVAKIGGGAHMFEFQHMDQTLRIGARNVASVTNLLRQYQIPILASDTGNNYGRTIELHTSTGILVVKTIGHGIKEI